MPHTETKIRTVTEWQSVSIPQISLIRHQERGRIPEADFGFLQFISCIMSAPKTVLMSDIHQTSLWFIFVRLNRRSSEAPARRFVHRGQGTQRARGMSQRDIAATIEDIYIAQMSHEQISITGCVIEAWRNRPCSSRSIHCLPTASSLRTGGVQQVAVYISLRPLARPLDQRDGEQACLDADLRRAAGSRR